MIGPAPTDLWDQVSTKLARLIYEREICLDRNAVREAYREKMPHLHGVPDARGPLTQDKPAA